LEEHKQHGSQQRAKRLERPLCRTGKAKRRIVIIETLKSTVDDIELRIIKEFQQAFHVR
jgi:hypothetical protein